MCDRPDTFYDGTRFRCRACDWQTPPTTEHARAIGPVTAAVCSCGAAVLHESTSVVAGFVADHEPGRRPGCVRVVTGHDLDEVCRRFASPEAAS